jgi:magnesium-transporting ATPase (P-type)
MSAKQKKPFYNRAWFVSIALFFIVQALFIFMEKTGWIPRYRDIDGKLLGKITELHFFKEWFQFYKTEWFNIISLLFALYAIIQIIVSTIKYLSMKGIGKA